MEIELPDGTVLDAPDGSDPSAVAKAYLAKSQQAPSTFMRNQGLGARMVAEGLGSVLTGPSDLLGGALNYGMEKVGIPYRFASSGQALSQGLTAAGLPSPQNQAEETVSKFGRAISAVPGYVATGGALAASGGPVAAGVGRSLVSNPMTQVASATTGTAGSELARKAGLGPVGQFLGGVAGAAIPAVGTAAFTRQEIPTDPAELAAYYAKQTPKQKAAAVLAQNDIPTYRYQTSESQTLKNIQAGADQLPFSGAKSAQQGQQRAFNKAMLSLTGTESDAATSDVMGGLQKSLGGTLNAIEGKSTIAFDPELAKDLSSIVRDARSTLTDQQYGVVERQLGDIAQKAANGSALTGKAFANIKQNLDSISMGPDQHLGSVARDLRDALQDALSRSLPSEDAAVYRDTLAKYRIMKQIEGAIDKKGTGDISALRLANILGTKSNRAQSIYGKGDQSLVNLAQSAAQIIPETVPDSGTARRVLYGLLAGGGYLNPALAAKLGIAGAVIPRALRALPTGPNSLSSAAAPMAVGSGIAADNALYETRRRNALGQ